MEWFDNLPPLEEGYLEKNIATQIALEAAREVGDVDEQQRILADHYEVTIQAHDFEEPDGFGIDFSDHPEAGWGPTQAELVLKEIYASYEFAEGIEERIVHNLKTRIEFFDGSFLTYQTSNDRWEAGHDDPS